MNKILICDDEGIVRESLQFILKKNFAGQCESETARNGRLAIEMVNTYNPDVVIMDIQMPGINGIEAMQEIRRQKPNIIFIVLTAYDRFEYSQAAIDVGVFSYLTKPINKDTFCDVIRGTLHKIKEKKQKASSVLKIKEKLEVVVPLIEGGFVYSILLEQSAVSRGEPGYRELLGITEEYGYAMVIECGDELHQGVLSNCVGAGIKLQKNILVFRDLMKETFPAIIGEVMTNRVVILVKSESSAEEYNERVVKIETTRMLLRKLEHQIGLKFKAGIGTVKSWEQMAESYREASETVGQGSGKVTHAKDLPVSCVYGDDYPSDLEKNLFAAIERGEVENTRKYSEEFMTWMENTEGRLDDTVRLKVIEFILWAERLAYTQGGLVYRFDNRCEYLQHLLAPKSFAELKHWFLKKMAEAAYHIEIKQQEKERSVIARAKKYIAENFKCDLSLEALAKVIGISPYYLSKLFKEIEGINYIGYVTKLKIGYAKESLAKSEKSIKEICHESGYGDPNYFSRIFKKWTGYTPTEFRERGVSL